MAKRPPEAKAAASRNHPPMVEYYGTQFGIRDFDAALGYTRSTYRCYDYAGPNSPDTEARSSSIMTASRTPSVSVMQPAGSIIRCNRLLLHTAQYRTDTKNRSGSDIVSMPQADTGSEVPDRIWKEHLP
jgi:hypothetical protein